MRGKKGGISVTLEFLFSKKRARNSELLKSFEHLSKPWK